jgi:16S rRNA G966 N2-methylase RsmD
MVVLERSSRTPMPELPEGLKVTEEKSYGDTVVYWLEGE